jgi:tRNA-binding protein
MTPAPLKPQIDLAMVEQIDVRVGTIRQVSIVQGSDTLVALQVSFGDHTRTIVAALRLERDDPHEIEGKQALFVVNLRPRTMRGVLSEGMLFDIGYADSVRPVLAVPESAVPDGVRAG